MRNLATLLFVLLLAACDEEEEVQAPLDSTIQIEVKEVVLGGAGRIVLHGKTEKEYPCAKTPSLPLKSGRKHNSSYI